MSDHPPPSTEYRPFPHQETAPKTALQAAGPLLLAVGGSALAPLPCAFAMSGIPLGAMLMILVAAANQYTTLLLVKRAARYGIYSYEGVVLAAGGSRALLASRIALVLLLFGSLCGSLAAMQETLTRAIDLIGLSCAPGSKEELLMKSVIAIILLPLSLASYGEMHIVSVMGALLMFGIASFVMYRAIVSGALWKPLRPYQYEFTTHGLLESSSIFGFSFYIQPCVLPMLRELPDGTQGEQILTRAIYITFGTATAIYMCVGVGGFLWFGKDAPSDLLTGFGGSTGAVLALVFWFYLTLCFAPILVPLRELLVRLYREKVELTRMDKYEHVEPSYSAVDLARDENDIHLSSLGNILVTSSIIALALTTTILVPGSEQLFAVTGATGVCLVAYIFPALVRVWDGVSRSSTTPFILVIIVATGTVISLCNLYFMAIGQSGNDVCVTNS